MKIEKKCLKLSIGKREVSLVCDVCLNDKTVDLHRALTIDIILEMEVAKQLMTTQPLYQSINAINILDQ